jgi:uncharacterized membrane protein YgcG
VRRRLLSGCIALAAAWLAAGAPVLAQEGWTIDRADIELEIQRDGTIHALEAFDVDFRQLPEKHGLLRDLVVRQQYDQDRDRRYVVDLGGVTDAGGRRLQVRETTEGARLRFRIGDPDRTVTGSQTYRITYRLDGALNPFPGHDELYWNATGVWPVPVERARVTVRLPAGGIERVDCFEGAGGGTDSCRSQFTAEEAVFESTRPLRAGEQLTVVVGLRKGVVVEPAPLLVNRPRGVTRFFDLTPWLMVGMWAGFAGAIGGVWSLWWRFGRDRRFVALHHGEDHGPEERVPLFGARPLAVEFEPPEAIRPGQMGLLVDEQADTLDVTATIIDLASRGYLTITEIPKTGWFGSADWELRRLDRPETELLAYERIVLNGLFGASSTRTLSSLKNTFYTHLDRAKKALYQDALERGWFRSNPRTVRLLFRVLGLVVAGGGLMLTMALGQAFGYGLLGLPVIAAGLLLAITAGAMPRRSAVGRRMLRRTLGFEKYIRTAERHPQGFAERANIFTAYLPYAVAFGCVDKWARAFRDIDLQAATASWYAGTTPFDPGSFSSTLGSFSSSVSSSMASTPGGSGGSGFSGGSSGGGGGGGGGGSW